MRKNLCIDAGAASGDVFCVALPPGPKAPAPVQTLRWLASPIESLERDFKKYGDIFTVRGAFVGTEVVVTRPESLKQVFAGASDAFESAESMAPFAPLLGASSVLLLEGEAHQRKRELLMPAFHGERMQRYTETMRDMTARMTASFCPGDRVELHPLMQRITLEVILRDVLGVAEGPALDGLRDTLTRLLSRVQSPLGALWMTPGFRSRAGWLPPLRSFEKALEDANALITKHIADRRASAGAGAGHDVLSMLLSASDASGGRMTDAELRDEVMTLLVVGHETTAVSLCWAFEEILSSPDEQARLGTEIEDNVGGEPLSADHLPKLKRLDAVIKEVLRLHPPTGSVGRRLKKPLTLQGYEIPPGVLIALCVHLTHRLPDLYPEPDSFKPERFLDKTVNPYEWLPFGGGDRRCVGMAFAMHEMKVVMATLLQRFRLRLVRARPAKASLRGLFYAPKGGTKVVVESDMAAPTVLS